MNATENEVALILAAIDRVDRKVDGVATEVSDARSDMAKMDTRINGRIRKLEAFRWQLVGMATLGAIGLNVALRFI